jgi:hypothetical protein
MFMSSLPTAAALQKFRENPAERTPAEPGTLAPVRQRVFVEDSRNDGTYLRATWHAEGRQFVVSTWRDDVCTGAVRVPASSAPELITLLADGLADAATRPIEVPPTPQPGVRERVQRWVASTLRRHQAA